MVAIGVFLFKYRRLNASSMSIFTAIKLDPSAQGHLAILLSPWQLQRRELGNRPSSGQGRSQLGQSFMRGERSLHRFEPGGRRHPARFDLSRSPSCQDNQTQCPFPMAVLVISRQANRKSSQLGRRCEQHDAVLKELQPAACDRFPVLS